MNDLARDTLTQAALHGVRQIRNAFTDDAGGLCALGVLGFRGKGFIDDCNQRLFHKYGIEPRLSVVREWHACPVDGCHSMHSEVVLISHLNDDHGWTFLDIANKFYVKGTRA